MIQGNFITEHLALRMAGESRELHPWSLVSNCRPISRLVKGFLSQGEAQGYPVGDLMLRTLISFLGTSVFICNLGLIFVLYTAM